MFGHGINISALFMGDCFSFIQSRLSKNDNITFIVDQMVDNKEIKPHFISMHNAWMIYSRNFKECYEFNLFDHDAFEVYLHENYDERSPLDTKLIKYHPKRGFWPNTLIQHQIFEDYYMEQDRIYSDAFYMEEIKRDGDFEEFPSEADRNFDPKDYLDDPANIEI